MLDLLIRELNMKAVLIISLLLQSTLVFAINKSISIDVSLSPAGSFQIKSKRIKGRGLLEGTKFSASNIKIPIKSLKTGIELRDGHLQKKLGIESNPKAVLLLVEAIGKNGAGSATFEVLGKKQTVPFTYKQESEKLGSAIFKLSLKKFGITGISYMGAGVEDIVSVKVICPFKIVKK
ncbi:MAG: hypothetical protein ACJAS4_003844 [Bacteriovoracaceae bacterium]|jgi:hypothetical protein|tara:strand:+ start:2072 stop:2605 length:534 start_codon:yes stop_codon:yes gene_type:complete